MHPLLTTFAGRTLLAGIVAKVVAFVLGLFPDRLPLAHDILDTCGDVLFIGGGLVIALRLFRTIRARLLWRVRRKLILSYVFIGVVPALLIICFFLLAGLLMMFNVSAYLIQSHVRAVVQEAQGAARVAAADFVSAGDVTVMAARHQAANPGMSFSWVPAPAGCDARSARGFLPGVSYGPWTHLEAPIRLPAWVTCEPIAGLFVHHDSAGEPHLVIRAVEPPRNGARAYSVVVDVPLDAAIAGRLRTETGIELGDVSLSGDAPAGVSLSRSEGGLRWVAFLGYRDWESGRQGTATAAMSLRVDEIYERLSASPLERLGSMSFGRILLIVLGVVGSAFLIIQVVALAMGLGLARSITGAVHELFAGTERVRQGDFGHKIPIRSRDQLGELAESFNSMTTSIEDLLQQKAEKERLEQELKIAREIQMSLLPHGAIEMPGLRLCGHCEPAREVGGDYYDFLPLEDGRIGVLIADVAGKGTSAALYMAELKGLILSLSQLHRSPRQLLIDANRIISNHLDDRAFITTTYAVVDTASRTVTYARAGHCPLIYRPGPGSADRRARLMAPEGLVLGLKIDNGEVFSRVLQEETLALATGDLLVLFTDGVTEAMNASDDCFGESRLAAIVEEYGDGEPQALRDQILREVRAFTGPAGAHDDVTMVIVNVQ